MKPKELGLLVSRLLLKNEENVFHEIISLLFWGVSTPKDTIGIICCGFSKLNFLAVSNMESVMKA